MFCCFEVKPKIGSVVEFRSRFTVVAVEDYVRKDGKPSFVVVWRRDNPAGRFIGLYTSGLKCSWPTKVKVARPRWEKFVKLGLGVEAV